MTKQVLHPRLIQRVFSTSMDFALFFVILLPILNIINRWIFIHKFGDILRSINVDTSDYSAVLKATQSTEFMSRVSYSDGMEITLLVLFIKICAAMLYFVTCWYKLGCTPIKYVMHMRIVDQNTMKRPKVSQLIMRFLGYFVFFIGIWWVLFTKQRQALHDKIAGTVVIKV